MRKLPLIILFLLFTANCFGATQLLKTVKPSGGDYTSLEACMNANEQDLVTADKYFDVEIDGTWSSADTTAVTIHNYTTDATRYINVYTTVAARHNGTVASGYKLFFTTTANSQTTLSLQENYVTINGLIIGISTANSYSTTLYIDTAASYLTIKNNIIYATTKADYGIYVSGSGNSYFYNNIIYNIASGFGALGQALLDQNWSYGTNFYYNNTVYNCGLGITISVGNGGNKTLKNNISMNVSTDFTISENGSGTIPRSNNMSQDATADGTGSLINKVSSNQFIDLTASSENLHLKTGADAIDAGTDLSATFTDDIDGVTRSGTWDIGADEFVAAGGTRRIIFIE